MQAVKTNQSHQYGRSSWILDNVDNIHFLKNQNKNDMIAGSFRVKLFIEWWCAEDLGKYSGCFMIIRWPISWFVYQVTSFYVSTCGCRMSRWHFIRFLYFVIEMPGIQFYYHSFNPNMNTMGITNCIRNNITVKYIWLRCGSLLGSGVLILVSGQRCCSLRLIWWWVV